jgi:hypothetical protein
MDVRLEERIAAGAPFAAPVLVDYLSAVRAGDADDERELEAMGVKVPIVLDVSERVGDPPNGARVRLNAKENAALFPVFEGTIRIEPIDAFSSKVVLEGRYDVPLGLLGALVDRTLLAKTAERSLQQLLERAKTQLAEAILRRASGG